MLQANKGDPAPQHDSPRELASLDAAMLVLHASSGTSTAASSSLPASNASAQTNVPAFQQAEQGWHAKRRRVQQPEAWSEDEPVASPLAPSAGTVCLQWAREPNPRPVCIGQSVDGSASLGVFQCRVSSLQWAEACC